MSKVKLIPLLLVLQLALIGIGVFTGYQIRESQRMSDAERIQTLAWLIEAKYSHAIFTDNASRPNYDFDVKWVDRYGKMIDWILKVQK